MWDIYFLAKVSLTFESNLGNAASVITFSYFTEVNLQEITPVLELTSSMYLQTKFLIQNFIYRQMRRSRDAHY